MAPSSNVPGRLAAGVCRNGGCERAASFRASIPERRVVLYVALHPTAEGREQGHVFAVRSHRGSIPSVRHHRVEFRPPPPRRHSKLARSRFLLVARGFCGIPSSTMLVERSVGTASTSLVSS